MKAFSIYSKNEIDLRILLDKLQKYGKCNCDFVIFSQIYSEWHNKTFPGQSVNTSTANFRDDWFKDFVNYLANKDI